MLKGWSFAQGIHLVLVREVKAFSRERGCTPAQERWFIGARGGVSVVKREIGKMKVEQWHRA